MTAKLLVMLILLLAVVAAAQAQNLTVKTITCPQSYKIVNDSITCVSCAAGFTAVNGTCTPDNTKGLNSGSSKTALYLV